METIELQSRGAVFGIDSSSEQFVLVSTNIDEMLGLGAPHTLVGKAFYDILGSDVSHALRNAETYRAQRPHRRLLGDLTLPKGQFELEVFFCRGRLIVEAVPAQHAPYPTALEVVNDVSVLTDSLLNDRSGLSAFKSFVALLRTISGYNCVVLERVTTGTRKPVFISGRAELAHCRVPSSVQLHTVEDISAPTVSLQLPENMCADFRAQSGLLGPLEHHRVSMHDAGVLGCASIVIEKDNEIWGRFKFLHTHPRVPSKRTQLAMHHIHPLIGQYLSNIIDGF